MPKLVPAAQVNWFRKLSMAVTPNSPTFVPPVSTRLLPGPLTVTVPGKEAVLVTTSVPASIAVVPA